MTRKEYMCSSGSVSKKGAEMQHSGCEIDTIWVRICRKEGLHWPTVLHCLPIGGGGWEHFPWRYQLPVSYRPIPSYLIAVFTFQFMHVHTSLYTTHSPHACTWAPALYRFTWQKFTLCMYSVHCFIQAPYCKGPLSLPNLGTCLGTKTYS